MRMPQRFGPQRFLKNGPKTEKESFEEKRTREPRLVGDSVEMKNAEQSRVIENLAIRNRAAKKGFASTGEKPGGGRAGKPKKTGRENPQTRGENSVDPKGKAGSLFRGEGINHV